MELRPGAVIAGRYRADRKIGAGGMGEVWAADHVTLGVRVALKRLLPAAACDQQIVARFRREAYLLGRLRSDRLARVVDFVEDHELGLVLVMDFVHGESLADVLEARQVHLEEAIDLGVDIAAALCDLHRAKVIHRDLKPDNIILEPLAGGRRRAVIVDFGVSRMESRGAGEEDSITGITQADVTIGTIPYMAPEQLMSSRDVSGSADLYAVGAILYRAVTGHHVYGDSEDLDYARRKLTLDAPPVALARFDRIARGFQAVVRKALQRRPEDRFESAEVMREELVALQDIARVTALDLDAATEQAPPSSMVDADAGERTHFMSRSSLAEHDTIDERSKDSSIDPVTEPRISTASIRELSMPAGVVEAPPRTSRAVSVRALVIAVPASLLLGFALGYLAGR